MKTNININIIDVVSEYINLKQKGDNYWGKCPFHNEDSPSFCVSVKRNIFKCFGCNVGGNAVKFYSLINNISQTESLIQLSNKFNLNLELRDYINQQVKKDEQNQKIYLCNKIVQKLYFGYIKKPNYKFALDYCYKRGLNDDLINQFKIGFAPENINLYDILSNNDPQIKIIRKIDNLTKKYLDEIGLIKINDDLSNKDVFAGRIIFPIIDINNDVLGFVGRCINENEIKYLNTKNTDVFTKSKVLYNLNNVLSNQEDRTQIKTIYIVEGIMDVIALYKIGIRNAVATLGVNFSNDHFNKLCETFPNLKNLVLCFDNDSAGLKAKLEVGFNLYSKINVYVVNNYENIIDSKKFKDIDEIVNYDQDLAKQAINSVIPYQIFLINSEWIGVNLNDSIKRNEFLEKTYEVLSNSKNITLVDECLEKIGEEYKINTLGLSKRLESYFAKYNKNNFAGEIKIKKTNKDLEHYKREVYEYEKKLIFLTYEYPNESLLEIYNIYSSFINKDLRELFIFLYSYYEETKELDFLNEKFTNKLFLNTKLYNTLANIINSNSVSICDKIDVLKIIYKALISKLTCQKHQLVELMHSDISKGGEYRKKIDDINKKILSITKITKNY